MSEDTQEDADRLEATRREVERLTKLRRDVASGLLEVSEAAKRDAERLLSATADTPGSGEVPPRPTDAEPSRVRSSPLLYGSFAIGILCGFLLAIFLRTPEVSPVDDVAGAARPGTGHPRGSRPLPRPPSTRLSLRPLSRPHQPIRNRLRRRTDARAHPWTTWLSWIRPLPRPPSTRLSLRPLSRPHQPIRNRLRRRHRRPSHQPCRRRALIPPVAWCLRFGRTAPAG